MSDIIASQIGWGKLLISWYEAGARGESFKMPGEGFTKWDYRGLAQHFYIKYQHNQEQEFYNAVKQIIGIVEKEYKTRNLEKLGVWPWCTLKSGKEWPLSKWVQINTVSPYKRSATLIKRFLKE